MKSSDEKTAHRFEERLLPMLLERLEEKTRIVPEAAPRRPLLRRWPAAAAVAGAALVVAIVVPVLSDDPLRGALAIGRHGDTLYLRVDSAIADPDAMTDEVRAAGLDARIEVIPVSPSLVGSWVQVVNDSTTGYNDPRIVDLSEQLSSWAEPPFRSVRVLKVPADFSTPITLEVGRAASEGEHWEISVARDVPDETKPGGVLYCLQHLDPPEVDRILRDLGYAVSWRVVPLPNEDVPPPSGKVIVYGEFLGPDTLYVDTADPGTEMAEHALERRASAEREC